MLFSSRLVFAWVLLTSPPWKTHVDDADRLRLEGQSTPASAAYASAYRALPLSDKTSVIGIRVLQLALLQAQEAAELPVLERALALAEEARETFVSTGTPWPQAVARAQEAVAARARELAAAGGHRSPKPPPQSPEPAQVLDPSGGSSPAEVPGTTAEIPGRVEGAGSSDALPSTIAEGAREGHAPTASVVSQRTSTTSRHSSPSHRRAHVALLAGGATLMSAGVGLVIGGVFVSDGTEEYAAAMTSPAYEALQREPERFAAFEAAVARWQTQRRTARVALWSSGAVALAAGIALVLIDVLPHARRHSGRVHLGRGLELRF